MKENTKKNRRNRFYIKKTGNKGTNYKWIIGITLWTFLISGLISFISDTLLSNVGILVAFIILVTIILIGIIFDIVGVSVTAADEVPFHSMASRKVKGARTSVALIRNADKVSNFCNDVVGDVCGVVSGGTGAVIITKILSSVQIHNKVILTLSISAFIASLTVGGKALGKNFAISQCNNIVYSVAWFIETIKRK